MSNEPLKYTQTQLEEVLAEQRIKNQKAPDPDKATGKGRYKKTHRIGFAPRSSAHGDVSGMEHYTMNQAGVPVYHAPQSKIFQGKPPQKSAFTILQDKIKIMQGYHDPITYHAPTGSEKSALWLKAKREDEHRQKDPVWQAERAAWDMQMAKVGLTPEGQQLSGLRSMMIERMNQLRGGR